MNIPADLSPEASAWLHTQIVISNARTAATLRREIEKVEHWADGIFVALRDLLFHQLVTEPELARRLASDWRIAAREFDDVHMRGVPARPGRSLDQLEACKMLFQSLTDVGALPRLGRD